MTAHEPKRCPRCGSDFECRLGSIHRCQCVDVPLGDGLREWLAREYDDCLCRRCLRELAEDEAAPGRQPASGRKGR